MKYSKGSLGSDGTGPLMVTATPKPPGAKGPGQVKAAEGHTGH